MSDVDPATGRATGTCLALPPFPTPPALPPGFTFPLFPGFTLPAIGLCCNIQIPPWGKLQLIPAIVLSIPLPPGIIAAYNLAVATIKKYYDAIAIPCPSDEGE